MVQTVMYVPCTQSVMCPGALCSSDSQIAVKLCDSRNSLVSVPDSSRTAEQLVNGMLLKSTVQPSMVGLQKTFVFA